MSKRIEMTRERKIALPIILEHARASLESGNIVRKADADKLQAALEAFNV